MVDGTTAKNQLQRELLPKMIMLLIFRIRKELCYLGSWDYNKLTATRSPASEADQSTSIMAEDDSLLHWPTRNYWIWDERCYARIPLTILRWIVTWPGTNTVYDNLEVIHDFARTSTFCASIWPNIHYDRFEITKKLESIRFNKNVMTSLNNCQRFKMFNKCHIVCIQSSQQKS